MTVKLKIIFATGLILLVSRVLSNSVEVRISELGKTPDYLFVRGELHGAQPPQGNIIDTLVTTNLLNWNWIDSNRLGVGTNTTALLYSAAGDWIFGYAR